MSDHIHRSRCRLEALFWESLMAGRIGRGEVWQFEEFSSETSLRVNGHPLYLDRFRLIPKNDPPNTTWMMGNARYLATSLCFDERAAAYAERIHLLLPGTGVGIEPRYRRICRSPHCRRPRPGVPPLPIRLRLCLESAVIRL